MSKQRVSRETPEAKNISVDIPRELRKGVYSNIMTVTHTAEEFMLDFALRMPPKTVIVARIMVSPGHMKRMVEVLQENLKRYEANFGEIEVPERIGGNFDYKPQPEAPGTENE